MRIITLTCSNTEIVCALGCADSLVGVDDYSDYPAEVVSRLPRVGPDLDIDIDKVAALEPDLVLASLTVPGHEKVLEGLAAAGLPFIAPDPVSLEDIYRDVREIAARLGVEERASTVVEEMRRQIPSPRRNGDNGHSGSPRILLQWWPRPVIAPGKHSWATELIEAAGGVNPLGEEEVKSRPLSDAEVRELDPDAMVISWCGVEPQKYRPEVVSHNPAWRGLEFVEQGRVYCIPEAHLGRPAPRLVEGYRALEQIVAELRQSPQLKP